MSVFKALLAAALALSATVGSPVPAHSQTPGMEVPQPPLLQAMVGTWDVQQRMWAGPDAEPTDLPPAVARRRMPAGGGFIDEEMTLAAPSAGDAFTRTAHLNYNAVDGVYEYHSIDSRAPQQMNYRTDARSADARTPLRLQGGRFVAAQWGERRNVAFTYRVELGEVTAGRQQLDLFLTPVDGDDRREFRAFEYRYAKRPVAG